MNSFLQGLFIGTAVTTVVLVFVYSVNQEPFSPSVSKFVNLNAIMNVSKYLVFKDSRIPRLVHYMYMHDFLPLEYGDLITSCLKLNQNVTFIFWTDKDVYKLIRKHYYDRLALYQRLNKHKFRKLKVSLVQSLILHRYGGVYMDLDTRCQKPLAPVLKKISCLVSADVYVKAYIMYNNAVLLTNSFMACIPQHRFSQFIIYDASKDLFQDTSSYSFTRLYEHYQQKFLEPFDNSEDRRHQLTLGNWREFSPYIHQNLTDPCLKFLKTNSSPSTFRERGCLLLQRFVDNQQMDMKTATVVHLYLNPQYSQSRVANTFNINMTFPQIVRGYNAL